MLDRVWTATTYPDEHTISGHGLINALVPCRNLVLITTASPQLARLVWRKRARTDESRQLKPLAWLARILINAGVLAAEPPHFRFN